MDRKRKDRGSFEGEFDDFVPAVFARSPEEAEEYRELLNDHDIPAIIDAEEGPGDPRPAGALSRPRKSISHGVPVLVPEVLLDEASEIIADRDYDEYRPGEEEDSEEDEEEELGPDSPPKAEPEDGQGRRPRNRKGSQAPFDADEDAFAVDDQEAGSEPSEDEVDPEQGEEELEEDEEEEEPE